MNKLLFAIALTLSAAPAAHASCSGPADLAGIWTIYSVFDYPIVCTMGVLPNLTISGPSSCYSPIDNRRAALKGNLIIDNTCHVTGTITLSISQYQSTSRRILAAINTTKNGMSGIAYSTSLYTGNQFTAVKQ